MSLDEKKNAEQESEKRVPSRPQFDANQIDELRKRLYARGPVDTPRVVRHAIPPRTNVSSNYTQSVSTTASVSSVPNMPSTHGVPDATPPTSSQVVASDTIEVMSQKGTRRRFRKIVAIVGVVFFLIATGVASFLMFWGGNTISGENISITATGPIAVGGGEEYEFQVAVANQNAVPIQSATLIVEYPKGTRDASGSEKELSIVRQSLESIDTGEIVNIPLKARIFGEENEDKEIKVWIEYRVGGSNATFERHAEPLMLKVTTSPLVMTFDTVHAISSGQEAVINLIVQSNSPTPLEDTLIKVTYPDGFDFTSSEPDTASGEDIWMISSLAPNEKKTITIKGTITGYEGDVRKFSVQAGVAKDGDRNSLGSQLATANTDIAIEQPFLDISADINGSPSDIVVVKTGDIVQARIIYKNTLNTTVYDGTMKATLGGNALDDYSVQTDGYYDSNTKSIRWESGTYEDLKEIAPGASVTLSFTLKPSNIIQKSPEVTIGVDVTGNRVYDRGASQKIEGTINRTIKVEGVPMLTSRTVYSEGPFKNAGPIPPVVGKTTQYNYLLTARAGVNNISGVEVTAVLPQGVAWLDTFMQGSDVTYNPTTRIIRWNVGNLDANTEVSMYMQVAFTPVTGDVGKSPTILETQNLKATDTFTGTTVRTTAPALTTNYTGNSYGNDTTSRVVAE